MSILLKKLNRAHIKGSGLRFNFSTDKLNKYVDKATDTAKKISKQLPESRAEIDRYIDEAESRAKMATSQIRSMSQPTPVSGGA